jgi:hypothetical protein
VVSRRRGSRQVFVGQPAAAKSRAGEGEFLGSARPYSCRVDVPRET